VARASAWLSVTGSSKYTRLLALLNRQSSGRMFNLKIFLKIFSHKGTKLTKNTEEIKNLVKIFLLNIKKGTSVFTNKD